ncbi:MAG: GTP-binding protein [Anaerolineae bacterium]|nr:GTP-binding protein [Anaerolineae bacterium]
MTINLPARLADLRGLLQALDWDKLSLSVQREAASRLAIVGPVNSGKSTLFNMIKGQKVSAVTAVPGTTRGVVEERMGPFLLVDTPGFGEVGGIDRAETAQQAAQHADVVLMLLDAAAGMRQSEYEIYQSLCATGVPLVVAVNKIDLIKRDLAPVLQDIEHKLGRKVIPISAKTGAGVAERLVPAIVAAHPWIAIAMARELPAHRSQLVHRIVRNAAVLNGLIAAEPIPGLDIPLLLTGQVRMVLRVAAIYGESLSVSHARELLTTIAGGVALRFLAAELAKLIPGPGWVIAGLVAGIGTWAMGNVAAAYFEGSKHLDPAQLRERYQQLRRQRKRPALGPQNPEAAPEEDGAQEGTYGEPASPSPQPTAAGERREGGR